MAESIDFELLHENIKKTEDNNAVLLFHGLTGSPFEMKKYGTFLYKQGYDVFCYSFPGHGERISEIETVTWQDWCRFAQEKYDDPNVKYNDCYKYAVVRNILYKFFHIIFSSPRLGENFCSRNLLNKNFRQQKIIWNLLHKKF